MIVELIDKFTFLNNLKLSYVCYFDEIIIIALIIFLIIIFSKISLKNKLLLFTLQFISFFVIPAFFFYNIEMNNNFFQGLSKKDKNEIEKTSMVLSTDGKILNKLPNKNDNLKTLEKNDKLKTLKIKSLDDKSIIEKANKELDYFLKPDNIYFFKKDKKTGITIIVVDKDNT